MTRADFCCFVFLISLPECHSVVMPLSWSYLTQTGSPFPDCFYGAGLNFGCYLPPSHEIIVVLYAEFYWFLSCLHNLDRSNLEICWLFVSQEQEGSEAIQFLWQCISNIYCILTYMAMFIHQACTVCWWLQGYISPTGQNLVSLLNNWVSIYNLPLK